MTAKSCTSPCITYQILLLSLIFLRIAARWHNMHIRYKLKRFWKKLLVLLPKSNAYLKNPGRIFRKIIHPASCHCPDWWLSWICRRNFIKLTVLLPGYSKTVSILDTQVIPHRLPSTPARKERNDCFTKPWSASGTNDTLNTSLSKLLLAKECKRGAGFSFQFPNVSFQFPNVHAFFPKFSCLCLCLCFLCERQDYASRCRIPKINSPGSNIWRRRCTRSAPPKAATAKPPGERWGNHTRDQVFRRFDVKEGRIYCIRMSFLNHWFKKIHIFQ